MDQTLSLRIELTGFKNVMLVRLVGGRSIRQRMNERIQSAYSERTDVASPW